jgi:hypothetical protein
MIKPTVKKTVSISNGKHDTYTVVHGTCSGQSVSGKHPHLRLCRRGVRAACR